MKVNASKTQVSVVSKVNILLHNQRLKQIRKLKYPDSTIVEDGGSDSHINDRIAIVKTAFNKDKSVMTNISISSNLRKSFRRNL